MIELRSDLIAQIIVDGFIDYRQEFHSITLAAKSHFEKADWSTIQEQSKIRIELYDEFSTQVFRSDPTRKGSFL